MERFELRKLKQESKQHNQRQNTNRNKRIKEHKEKYFGSYICSICEYEAKSKLLLQYHYLDFHKTDHGMDAYKCLECSYKTLERPNFVAHVRRTHGIFKTNLFYCANCPFTAKQKRPLQAHLSRHYLKAKFQCSFCSYSSNRQSATYAHQWIHPEYKRNTIYTCLYCLYETRIKSHFERHHLVHKTVIRTENKTIFRCIFCPFVCSHKSSLDRHNEGHERKHGIQCSLCSYTAKSRGGMTLHRNNQHFKENLASTYLPKEYKCTTCAFQTNQKSHYSRHLNTHIDNNKHEVKTQKAKLFYCSSCSYITIKRSDLIRHESKHLTPEEVCWFYCNECPFKAKRKYQLAGHSKNHNMTEGIQCFYCSYRSSSKAASLKHLKLHL